MEPMRIMHVLEGSAWSGGQQQALLLSRELHRRGYPVRLVCQNGSELASRAGTEGLDVRTLPFRSEIDPRSLIGLYAAMREFRPTVVNVHRAWAHTHALLLSLLAGHRGLIVTRRVAFSPDRNPVSRVKYRSAAIRGFIAVSEQVRNRLLSFGVAGSRIAVVHPATDTDRFDPARVQVRPPLLAPVAGRPLVLMVGNHHRNKGHEVLLTAVAIARRQHPDLAVAMVGHGTDGPGLRELVARLDLAGHAVLAGFDPDVPAWLQAASVLVNASFEEGFAGSLREAMAMGVPVVASDIPANRELVGSAAGASRFPSGNAEALATALLQALARADDPVVRAGLRRCVIERFSVPAMVDATVAAYRRLLSRREPR